MTIDVHIDSLVLHGFSLTRSERRDLQREVEGRLGGLLEADRSRPWQARRQRSAAPATPATSGGAGLGTSIATAVHQAVRHGQ